MGLNAKLNVYGILEIGDVPRFAFVIKLTPNEFNNNPILNKMYRFNIYFLLIVVSPYQSYYYIFYKK